MVFSSLNFIFIFLPLFLIVYYLMPAKFRNAVLFFGSIIFYSVGSFDNPVCILLILMSITANYSAGRVIEQSENKNKWLILALVYNFLWLFIFKYTDFFADEIFGLFSLNLILPIGISFYTFQAVSYIIDVYRGNCEAEKSFINFGAYLSMFPQLIAGPIVTYESVRKQLHERKTTPEAAITGLKTFIIGLGFKVILANNLGGLWSDAENIGFESLSTPLALLSITAFTFQIYFDFYGYSLMAIGLGKMLGFELPQNFNDPYTSRSMTEFWRRWHITLGSWFREYVYIPLGGNRNGQARTYINLFIVWALTGLWHGAHLNFLLWGIFLFAVIAIEKTGLLKALNRYSVIGHIYMLILIPLSWSLFALTDLSELVVFLKRLAGISANGGAVFAGDWLKYGKDYGPFIAAGFFFSTKLPKKLYEKYKDTVFVNLLLPAIFWVSVYCLYQGLNDPFLYFRF